MSTTTPVARERDSKEDYRDESSDAESEFDNDPVAQHARNSRELAEHDRGLLDEEEERETLLTGGRAQEDPPKGFFGRRDKDKEPSAIELNEKKKRPGRTRKGKRGKKRNRKDEEGELLYEMEEGRETYDASSQASSSSAELDKLDLSHSSMSKRRKLTLWHILFISIAALVAALSFAAYEVVQNLRPAHLSLLSNGTSTFAPTTILISLDGFRADFLTRGVTPTLNQFIAEGVSPKYMKPSFPSVTFPNHYTLVTGLYPESHGVVGNTFWDPDLEAEFHYTDPARSLQPKWWAGGEPLWVTAEKQNVKAAIHMWPGSEAGVEFGATYVDKFNGSEVLSRKTERILGLLDLPSIENELVSKLRPQFIAAYVPNVDSMGHKFGPNSTEVWDTISSVDTMLHDIFAGLEERNLTDLVNVVVVSDHGMATTSTDRLIQLDDLIDLDLVEHIDGWPLYGLRPKDPIDLRGLYDRLLIESQKNGNFDVYLKENMPERYHFSNNDRIAPLWVIPNTGWAIVHKEDFDVKAAKAKGETYHPKGLHGYDHENSLMRAIFVARGPAFPHLPNSRLENFQNTEVYNIVCDSLGLEPKPNNGTLRLPLKPIGLHSDKPTSSDDSVPDFPAEASEPNPAASSVETSVSNDKASANDTKPVDSMETEGLTDTVSSEDGEQSEEAKEALNNFWALVKAKMKAAQQWAKEVIASLKANHSDAAEQESGT
ncbi:alkaline-phosphatase-like protein [Usnea florida]